MEMAKLRRGVKGTAKVLLLLLSVVLFALAWFFGENTLLWCVLLALAVTSGIGWYVMSERTEGED